jgi:hypothetical protein
MFIFYFLEVALSKKQLNMLLKSFFVPISSTSLDNMDEGNYACPVTTQLKVSEALAMATLLKCAHCEA